MISENSIFQGYYEAQKRVDTLTAEIEELEKKIQFARQKKQYDKLYTLKTEKDQKDYTLGLCKIERTRNQELLDRAIIIEQEQQFNQFKEDFIQETNDCLLPIQKEMQELLKKYFELNEEFLHKKQEFLEVYNGCMHKVGQNLDYGFSIHDHVSTFSDNAVPGFKQAIEDMTKAEL